MRKKKNVAVVIHRLQSLDLKSRGKNFISRDGFSTIIFLFNKKLTGTGLSVVTPTGRVVR